jgi:hypothetical protein
MKIGLIKTMKSGLEVFREKGTDGWNWEYTIVDPIGYLGRTRIGEDIHDYSTAMKVCREYKRPCAIRN